MGHLCSRPTNGSWGSRQQMTYKEKWNIKNLNGLIYVGLRHEMALFVIFAYSCTLVMVYIKMSELAWYPIQSFYFGKYIFCNFWLKYIFQSIKMNSIE